MRNLLLKRTGKGFTLVELMIVIAIIGVLAAVGYPAYTSSVQKAKRADAIDALLTLAGRMEEFYMNNDTYVGANVATLVGRTTSPEGYYTLSLTGQTAFYYQMVATPASTDLDCGNLSLDSLGVKGVTAGAVGGCW